MNKFIGPENVVLVYKTYKPKLALTEYVKISSPEMALIQFMMNKFYDHVWQKQNINSFQHDLYTEIFDIPRPDTLPRPKKVKFKGMRVNTYATLMEGLMHNFNTGTEDFSIKTFEHAVFVYNLAVKYFDEIHSDYEPTFVAHYFKPMKSVKI